MSDSTGATPERLAPLRDRAHLQDTLTTVLDHAMPALAQAAYCLVGTGAALLRGVPLPAGDIDLLMKQRAGVDLLGTALSSFKCLTPPVYLPDTRQYYAAYEVNGVEVGASTVELESESDCFETFGQGPWQHFDLIPCGVYRVPTVALELRLSTELYRDRPDRYTPLIEWMKRGGCDLVLFERAMQAAGLPPDRIADVLRQIQA